MALHKNRLLNLVCMSALLMGSVSARNADLHSICRSIEFDVIPASLRFLRQGQEYLRGRVTSFVDTIINMVDSQESVPAPVPGPLGGRVDLPGAIAELKSLESFEQEVLNVGFDLACALLNQQFRVVLNYLYVRADDHVLSVEEYTTMCGQLCECHRRIRSHSTRIFELIESGIQEQMAVVAVRVSAGSLTQAELREYVTICRENSARDIRRTIEQDFSGVLREILFDYYTDLRAVLS